MNILNNTPYNKNCDARTADCEFRLAEYRQGETFDHGYEDTHYIVYCSRGVTRLKSNLFKEEMIYGGEILFLPRMTDCRGEVMEDACVIIHIFNNNVCTPENCILSYLYRHRKRDKSGIGYRCKLPSYKALDTFMESIMYYLEDKADNTLLWQIKHKELIHLLCRHFHPEDLQLFFHPIAGDNVPFKSLVLAHYRKAGYTKELAKLCGYGVYTFRRIFKKEFAVSAYQWLIKKRAEHIFHKLTIPYIPFSEIINEFNFSSSANFSSFCKKFLGDTPSNLRNANKDKETK